MPFKLALLNSGLTTCLKTPMSPNANINELMCIFWDVTASRFGMQKSSPPSWQLTESFTTDRGYAYGIGLHAVVAETNINLDAIVRTIQRFRALGERDWSE